jgi:O-antigen ligase
MFRTAALVVLYLFQLALFGIGIKIHPVLMIGIPAILIIAIYLIYNPMISLLLFVLSGIVKDFFINSIPFFQVVDYSLLFTIIIWIGLIRIYLIGEWKIPNWSKSILITYILFCTFLLFSGFYTPSPNYGWLKIFRFIVFNSTMFLTPFIIIRSIDDSKRLLILLRNVLIIIAILMIFYILYSLSITSGISFLLRVSILGANPITVGSFIAIAVGMLTIVMVRNSYKLWVLYLPLLILLIIGLISTGSRGPIISLLLGLFIYLVFFEKESRKKISLLSGTIVFSIIILLFILPENLTTRYLNYTAGDLIIHQEGVKRVSTIAMRLQYWELSISEWSRNIKTLLVGVGSGGFSSFYIMRDYRFYPHNMFIEVIVELGLLGLSLFLIFWYKIGKILFRSYINLSIVSALWITAFLVRFFGSQFSGDIGGNRDMWLYLSLVLISTNFEQLRFSTDAIENINSK